MEVWLEAIAGRKPWKNSKLLWKDLLRSRGQESDPVSVEHRSIDYTANLVQLAIWKQVGEQILAM